MLFVFEDVRVLRLVVIECRVRRLGFSGLRRVEEEYFYTIFFLFLLSGLLGYLLSRRGKGLGRDILRVGSGFIQTCLVSSFLEHVYVYSYKSPGSTGLAHSMDRYVYTIC
jgi:hypothetical protein